MRDRQKKPTLLILMMLVALALIVLTSVLASQTIYGAATYVYDYADILSDSEEQSLANEVASATEATGWNIVLATTADTGGRSTMAYADDLYDATFGINTDGIALVIDMENRNYYISTSGSAISTITDSRVERVLDAGYDSMRSGDYGEALSRMLSRAVRYRTDEKPHLAASDFVLAGVLAAIVFFAMVGTTAARYRLKWGTYTYDYHKGSRVQLTNAKDIFVNQFVTHHRIESSGGGGGGGSSTHTSSSGGTHGGGGRSF